MWPGYSTSIKNCVDGIFLSVDVCARFVQKETILEKIEKLRAKGKTESEIAKLFDSSNNDIARIKIITSHNGQEHLTDGIDFSLTPATCFFKLPNGQETSVKDYFSQRYKIALKED